MDSSLIHQLQALTISSDHSQDQTATHEQCIHEPMLVDAKDQCAYEAMLVDAKDQSQDENNINASLIEQLKALTLTSDHNQDQTITHKQRTNEPDFTSDGAHTKDTAPNKAAQVFATTELMEMILLNANHRPLRSNLQQVSKRFRDTIHGSPKIQRCLYYTPEWNRATFCPAPIPTNMLNYIEYVQDAAGNFLYNCAPEVTDSKVFILRSDRDAIAWACDEDRTANSTFRNMLVCQPPPVAVEVFCWTTGEKTLKPKNVQRRIASADGIRIGELFDLVKDIAPIGQARATYTFRRQTDQAWEKPTRKTENQWLLELRAIAKKSSQFPQ